MASEVMTLQAQAGKRADSGFKKEAWTEALAAFNNRFQTKLSRQQIKSKLTALKGIYTSIKAMLDASGFGWDDERHVVLVHDSVWDDYVKVQLLHTTSIDKLYYPGLKIRSFYDRFK
ncbi:hypothetical protein F442_12389 [Phytophthora nicotianae P10297]|uniref:Myb/SANT-like domain-containing protein n=3 Tax=Phytophthora nicotianae TaxID=4792 RepID=V9EU83_PHYNI|nr:hypothetical protein F443_12468 [Phytophthora nicotianae P1569]ETP40241.1 hypothetical protein F442_12389 [Phytophthora nicotianae P10297]